MGQVRSLRYLDSLDQRRHDRKVFAAKCLDQLVADHISLVVKSRQVICIRPAWTYNSYADSASRQRVVDLVVPLADADVVYIAEYVLTSKGDSQPVVEPATRT